MICTCPSGTVLKRERERLITLEVGSRGVIHLQGFLQMQKHLDCSKKDLKTLLVRISNTAIHESFKIRCTRSRDNIEIVNFITSSPK